MSSKMVEQLPTAFLTRTVYVPANVSPVRLKVVVALVEKLLYEGEATDPDGVLIIAHCGVAVPVWLTLMVVLVEPHPSTRGFVLVMLNVWPASKAIVPVAELLQPPVLLMVYVTVAELIPLSPYSTVFLVFVLRSEPVPETVHVTVSVPLL